jgi:glutathione S-transferase
MTSVTLGYWKIRGLAQPARLLLAYTNTPFTDVQYTDKEKWLEDKASLGIEFPNLPYLIDGDFKFSESNAIYKHIIRRSGHNDLLGKTVQDEASVNNILGVLGDLFKEIFPVLAPTADAQARAAAFEKVKPKFEFLKGFVGEREFALGYLTLADFILAERLYFLEAAKPDLKKDFKFLWRIRHNFEQLPAIQAYYTRPDAVVEPFTPTLPHIKYRNVKLGYWGIRGLGHVPRLLLSHAGVEFEDKTYTESPQWFAEDKVNLGLNFPNLPYLIDGEFNITESSAIQRYIIQRWGNKELLGKDANDQARVEAFLSIFNEAAGAIRGLFFNKDHETAKVGVLEKYIGKLTDLDKSIGEKPFVLGYLTLADFIVAEDSHYIQRVYPEEYKKLSFLHRIRENFENLAETKAYYAKPTAFKGRFFPAYAQLSVEQ